LSGAQRSLLPDGRWHFQHGPIDIVIHADGQADAVQSAHQAAWLRFETVLAELVAELPRLRQPVAGPCPVQGLIARRMWTACAPLVKEADGYLTPMAAVAGAVAQTLVEAYQQPGIQRAGINNGGDIALHLAPGSQTRIGLYADLARFDAGAAARTAAGRLRTDLDFAVHAHDPVRGVATSGWRGRSHSRGIADSVTVLAATAAMADAAATVIANAVDLADAQQAVRAGIVRLPANSQRDDSDLGAIDVTVAVPPLPAALVQQALQRGLACAHRLQARGLVQAVLLVCQGSLVRLPAPLPLRSPPALVQ
jgi:ApbE superfamily uncharacterized protein (UPF0280 family)